LLTVCISFLLGLSLTIIYAIGYANSGSRPQGRYMFVVLGPFAILMTLGWSALVPLRFQRQALTIVCIAVVLFDVVSVVTAVLPVYYG
jgi:hypothetical protein